MTKDNCPEAAEFEGTTKQQIKTLTETVKEITGKVDTIQKWIWVMTGALAVVGITNLPEVAKVLAEGIK